MPFKTFTGLNEDRKNAGRLPASKPVASTAARVISQNKGFANGMLICSCVSVLKYGKDRKANRMQNRNEMRTVKTDSVRNWKIRSVRLEPIVFRTPTSRALF